MRIEEVLHATARRINKNDGSKKIQSMKPGFSAACKKVKWTDLGPIQVLGLSVGGFVPLELLGEGEDSAHKPE